MFEKSAAFYDVVYGFKDYAREAERLHQVIGQHKRSRGRALLDVACGTGAHLATLQAHYQVEGLDLDPGMLAVARQKLPQVTFHEGDMVAFDLKRSFDVVTCLFSSIGYMRTLEGLRQAVANMARHVTPGGLLLVEPWFSAEDFREGSLHSLFIDQPELKIARLNLSRVDRGVSIIDFHYLVGTPAGIEFFREQHQLGLFRRDQYVDAFEAAGLETSYDADGLSGRGLVIGRA
jgi:SAM-dependent methyltransferase